MSTVHPHATGSSRSDSSPRLLIVDDDAAALRLLSAGLTAAGFDVKVANSGEAALEIIRQVPLDAVVLDFEMPGLDGAEVCSRIRATETTAVKELPVIMLTAHTSEADEVRCLEVGANDFVTKPASRAVLQARIQTQLRLRGYAKQLEEWRAIQEADLASARATQKALVPEEFPAHSGWEVQARHTPLIQIGGDIYGWERMRNGRWMFWMSDATGHGAAAALITALTAHLFSKAAEVSSSPAHILATVNREFLSAVGGNTFMTACCAVVEADGTMHVSSAGHPPIIVIRRDGSVESVWAEKTILGLRDGLTLRDKTVKIGTGEVALLYTDGLYSSKGKDGERLSHDIVAQAASEKPFTQDIIGELSARIQAHTNGDPMDDDLAVIALRRTGDAAEAP